MLSFKKELIRKKQTGKVAEIPLPEHNAKKENAPIEIIEDQMKDCQSCG